MLSDCIRIPTGFSDRKVKFWSSKSDRIRISLVLMSKCGGTGWMSCRTYGSVWYRYRCYTYTCTYPGIDVHIGTAGTGIHIVPTLPKSPVPILMSHRSYRSVRYRYRCRTELTVVSGTGRTVGIPRYVPYRTRPCNFIGKSPRYSDVSS